MKRSNKYDIEKICKYCEHSSALCDGDNVLCSKKGVVSSGYSCRKFLLDIMQIDPKRPNLNGSLEYIDIDKTND